VTYIGQEDLATELARLRRAVEEWGATDAFVPAVSPSLAASSLSNTYYATHDDFLEAVIAALRVEYQGVIDAGFMLQLDCPDIPMVASRLDDLRDIEASTERAVLAINAATEGLPPDRLRLHLCWGNWEGPHRFDVALRKVLPQVLKARPHAISFEAANPRHAHEWDVFEDIQLPDGKVIMPGVIDTKNNVLEHPELVAQRIERFAGLVGRENVIPGTDCGFGTFAGFGAVFPKVAWMKLEALGQGAALASSRLWPTHATM
jgi:5-methyltetrahydropteroyltriglutamate--homocysteine methyltransferase